MPIDHDLNPDEMLEQVFTHVARIASQQNAESVVTELAEMARSITRADRCTVWVYDGASSTLWTYLADGIEKVTIPVDSGIVGYAVREQKRLIVNDVYADARFNPEIDQQTGYQTHNMMVVPMISHDGKLVGAVQLINKLPEGSRFEQEHLKYVMMASTYAAEAILRTLPGGK